MRDQIPNSRRRFLSTIAATGLAACARPTEAAAPAKKRVAGVVTIYKHNSHADVILSKILKGWNEDGGPGPALELTSLYVDQFPTGDLARDLSRKFGFPICRSIDEAMTLGSDKLAVDGVLSIGEHGDYPYNEQDQHLYPRRRFFDAICDTMERCGQVVPVFNDKHPGPQWKDALAMVRRARQMKIPFMAGSSLPVTFRAPDVRIPFNADIRGSIAIGYGGLDAYGFHTFEFHQCLIERRKGGPQGVTHVQAYAGEDLARLIKTGQIDRELLDAVCAVTPHRKGDVLDANPKNFALFLTTLADSTVAPILMLGGYARGIGAAVRHGDKIAACEAVLKTEPRFPHFAYLLKGVEKMMHTGRPTYPVERTLMTAGLLDRSLTSRALGGKKIATPELNFSYAAVDYPHAPHLDLKASP